MDMLTVTKGRKEATLIFSFSIKRLPGWIYVSINSNYFHSPGKTQENVFDRSNPGHPLFLLSHQFLAFSYQFHAVQH